MSKALPLFKQYLNLLKEIPCYDRLVERVKIVSVGDGHCKAEFKVQEDLANVFGHLHGGVSASLVDIISGIALLSHKREGGGVSVNMNLTYLKGAEVGEDIVVEAKTIKAGKNLGFLEVEIKKKETGELLVTGTHTKFIG